MGVTKHRKNHKQKLKTRNEKINHEKNKFKKFMANLQKVQTADEYHAALKTDAIQDHKKLIDRIEQDNLLELDKSV